MSDDLGKHDAVVGEWIKRANGSSSPELVDRFEAGIHRMWNRAQPTLGEVTLGAIVDRVLYTACERFPFLAPLHIRDGSVQFDDLRKGVESVVPAELASATRFVMLEFLTVLGHLTAEILTPALHAELSAVRHGEGHPKSARRRTKT